MKIALTIPGYSPINPGGNVPTGGLFGTGANIIRTFIILFITISILVALYLIVQGGIDIIMSRGHKESIVRGREKVIFAFVGLIFILLAYFLVNVAKAFFGFDLIPFLKFN